jgi:hypothetical protein
MQLIKPERKVIFPKSIYNLTDINIHFHYAEHKKSKTKKRIFRLSIVHFLRKNNLKWKYISFAIDNGKIIFTEGYNKNSFRINQCGYVYNMSLIMQICDIYKIKISKSNQTISFISKEIRKNIWELMPQ